MTDLFLSTVEGVFTISGVGTVLFPGIPAGMCRVCVRQPIAIVKPDGEMVRTHIKEFPMVRRVGGYDGTNPIALPKSIKREDIPIGSQVWIEAANLTPEMIEYQETERFVQAIKEGEQAITEGKTVLASDFFAEIRAKHGF